MARADKADYLARVSVLLKTFPFDAVIFDLDGVLADTEMINFRAIQDMFDPQEVRLEDRDFPALYGLDYFATAEYLRGRFNLSEAVESLVMRQEQSALRRISLELVPAEGVLDLIRGLHARGIPLGLASNSPRLYVRHVLERLGVAAYIPQPVSRDDVDAGKPDPAPYLAACRRLGQNPAACLAVEDSAVGMQSALAAGLSVALVGPKAPEPPSQRVTRSQNITQLAAVLLVQ